MIIHQIDHNYELLLIKLTVYEMLKQFNPYSAEFLKWNNPPFIFVTVHYQLTSSNKSNGHLPLTVDLKIMWDQSSVICREIGDK